MYIKNKISIYVMLMLGLIPVIASAQQGAATDFSLQAAIDYATKHNSNYLNAELDVKYAEYKLKETVGIGLPQINASVDVKDYVKIPTSLLPAQIFGGPAGTFVPVKFGTQYNASGGISASQLIFSSDYLVGLQASKEYMNLSKKSLNRSKNDIVVNVSKAYYGALMNREQLKTLDANLERLEKLLNDTKAMNEAGFVEKIDVDRIQLAYNNLIAQKETINRLIGVGETLLKFQMGYPLQDQINLTDKLDATQFQDLASASAIKTDYTARPEFSLLESQRRLNELDLKRYRLAYLPTLAAYSSFTYQAQRTKFNFLDQHADWFPIGIVGATLNIPIFSGGQKYYRIQQAKVNLQKTNNTINLMKSAIDLETSTAAISYQNAYASMITQQNNKELAQSIYDVAKKKYDAGVGTNLEVITAQTSLKESETNYLNAVYSLIVSKIELDRAQGNIK